MRTTAKANSEMFNISDGLVVRNVKRNVVGSREQLSLQTTLEGGRHDDASNHSRKTFPGIGPSDWERALAEATRMWRDRDLTIVLTKWYLLSLRALTVWKMSTWPSRFIFSQTIQQAQNSPLWLAPSTQCTTTGALLAAPLSRRQCSTISIRRRNPPGDHGACHSVHTCQVWRVRKETSLPVAPERIWKWRHKIFGSARPLFWLCKYN